MWKAILWVAIGGSIGSVFRFLGQKWLNETWGNGFPYGTLIVNITGCLLIGLLFGTGGRWTNYPEETRLLLMTGFCGGFTTFSAFSLESLSLLQQGRLPSFIIYVTLSITLCLLGTLLGYWISRQF